MRSGALRLETLLAAVVFSVCLLISLAPVQATNLLLRRSVAEDGDLYFTLAYRLLAIVGTTTALYLLVVDLWTLAHL